MLGTIGPEQRELPSSMQSLTAGLENSATVNCSGAPAPVATPVAEAPDALAAQAGTAPADLSALPAPIPSAEAVAPSPGIGARIAAAQSRFYRSLTEALKSLQSDGGAFWWLGGISFLYGIFHAAGPGHGKVVVSSYLLANELEVRRGIGISFLAAFAQAVTAIVIVGVMAIVLGATSTAMDTTAGFLESASYALVLGIGIYLVLRKGRDVVRAFSGAPVAACGHAHHHHHHGHAHASHAGHVHAPAPRAGGSALATILSVGLRPCTGALVVLVFALAQGVLWAGIAATLQMAFGTAITVAALATLAVAAKGFAARLARTGGGHTAEAILLALELAAALLIAALGGVLLFGSLA
jgi:ABC-type nickel/cobalt efflux system permease component RcnA